jgi:hypothetical protein
VFEATQTLHRERAAKLQAVLAHKLSAAGCNWGAGSGSTLGARLMVVEKVLGAVVEQAGVFGPLLHAMRLELQLQLRHVDDLLASHTLATTPGREREALTRGPWNEPVGVGAKSTDPLPPGIGTAPLTATAATAATAADVRCEAFRPRIIIY